MSRCSTSKNIRLWLLLTILAYICQLLGVNVYALDKSLNIKSLNIEPVSAESLTIQPTRIESSDMSRDSAPCHDLTLDAPQETVLSSQSCCDYGECDQAECQMINCHSSSALLYSISALFTAPHPILNTFAPNSSPTRSPSFLYRPPIVG